MAKRKRLTMRPIESGAADEASDPEAETGVEAKAMFPLGVARHRPPIAATVGEDAAVAALREVSDTLAEARLTGRFVQQIPLDHIETGYLTRDRVHLDDEDMAALIESLRARGQQTPIEVVALTPEGALPARYGLISGWRRLQALQGLRAETGEARFEMVLAVERRPETQAAAYLAMVEENEIRAGLSYYERARIALKAVEHGAYATQKQALGALFGSGSRARRSKIKAFIRVVEALDGALGWPAALPERLGLRLSKALEGDPELGPSIRQALSRTPPQNTAEELARLQRALEMPNAAPAPAAPSHPVQGEELAPGLVLETGAGIVKLSGSAVTGELKAALRAWLRERC